jgi:hypothetical protein
MTSFVISTKGRSIMSKIPKKVLRWREKQPRGAIMSPEKFKSMEKAVAKSGSAEDPKAVVGAKYWEDVMKKYHEKHCPAEPL